MIAPAQILSVLLADASPLAGRLAFAGVFVALIVWLFLIPRSRLAEAATTPPKPLWQRPRLWALLIATLQATLYLLWK